MQLESSVTLFDDNKVEDRFAELQVTADGITAEVGRKVGNDEVISRINQSAEAVTIQANKINIDGAITAINNNTTTTINGGKITTNTLNGDRIIANTINGDRIIANTVSTGAINANSGTFNTANIPNLNASKITAGTLSADRIGAGTLSVGKIDATSGTFNTANIPNLSATKITSDTINGARINAMGASGGARATLTSTGLDIYNSSNQKKASYGATQYIYGGNGTYPLISVDGTNARLMQSANNYANVNSSGMQIYQDGANVASFGSSTIELGKNSISSVISLCGGKGTIERHNTLGLLISTTESDKSVTLRTPSYSRVSVNPNSIELFVDTYTYLEVNADTDRIYMSTHTQPSEGSTSTSTGFYLGLSAYRWRQLYCWSAPNTGSDGKRKDVIGNIDFAKDLIMGLKPVEFQWKDSDHKRSHMGFIAQDAAKVSKLLGKDLSFYEAHYIDESKGDYHGEDAPDEELSWGMMYDELIAPLVKVVQMQQKEIDQLKIELKHTEDAR